MLKCSLYLYLMFKIIHPVCSLIVFPFYFFFPAPNTGPCSPCWLLSVWFSSTSWFKGGAHGYPRLPSPLDLWASTATGPLLAMSRFPGNARVKLHPSKFFFFVNPAIIISFAVTVGKLLSSVGVELICARLLCCC